MYTEDNQDVKITWDSKDYVCNVFKYVSYI